MFCFGWRLNCLERDRKLIPLGANTGFKTATFGLYLVLPLILIYISSLTEIKIAAIHIKEQEVHFLKVFINVGLLIFSLVVGNMYFAAYEDSRNRWSMLHCG